MKRYLATLGFCLQCLSGLLLLWGGAELQAQTELSSLAPIECRDFPMAGDTLRLGWDPAVFPELEALSERAEASAVMIVTGGQVVFSYGPIEQPMFLASIRKSILSALIGIAVDKGALNLEDTLEDWSIQDNSSLSEIERRATVRDLISSRSGVYIPTAAETARMRDQRPGRGTIEPGSKWFYNNWDFNVVGEIFERATQKSIFLAFDQFIAKPLCMQDFDAFAHTWYVYSDAAPRFPAYHMALSARDLARFGQLYLQQGIWGADQLLPEGWVADSTMAVSTTEEEPELASGYGFMWWVTKESPSGPLGQLFDGSYTAMGSGGQRMTILPSIDTVILARADIKPGGVGASAFKDSKLWQSFITTALQARRAP